MRRMCLCSCVVVVVVFISAVPAGEMRPVLADERDRDVRPHPSDAAGHGGAGHILRQDFCTF